MSEKMRICFAVVHPEGPMKSRGLPNTPEYGRIVRSRAACDPSAKVHPLMHTVSTHGVTCPQCKETEEFKRAANEAGPLTNVNES